jgi:hypothetical protein
VLKIIIYDKQHKKRNHPERHKVFAVVERLPNKENLQKACGNWKTKKKPFSSVERVKFTFFSVFSQHKKKTFDKQHTFFI